MSFVSIHGQPVSISGNAPKRPKREQPGSFRNGWRVSGIPPGALEAAREQHQREAAFARDSGKPFKDWDEQHWLMNAKRKSVRAKPYEVPEAAKECRAMAEKAGWLRVEVMELKKEAA